MLSQGPTIMADFKIHQLCNNLLYNPKIQPVDDSGIPLMEIRRLVRGGLKGEVLRE